jgi:N-acetylglutamate synthase-like GNAT family acetyltransferase
MIIRAVSADDCPGMTELTRALGYPSSSEKMCEILEMVMHHQDHSIFVAEIDQNLAGYIHLVMGTTDQERNILNIAALLVDKQHRSRGVGKAFLAQAEQSARDKAANVLRIRTNLISPEAYAFFENHGFINLNTKEVFVKELAE